MRATYNIILLYVLVYETNIIKVYYMNYYYYVNNTNINIYIIY